MRVNNHLHVQCKRRLNILRPLRAKDPYTGSIKKHNDTIKINWLQPRNQSKRFITVMTSTQWNHKR